MDGTGVCTDLYNNMRNISAKSSFFFRYLEHFLLNGPDPKALDVVLQQLSDSNRKNPQELYKAIIGINSFKLLLVL